MIKIFVSLALLIAATTVSFSKMEQHEPLEQLDSTHQQEALYLPKSEALDAISFGYRNVLSRVLWFHTINYFGKHYRADRNYYWLENMCKLVVALDPRADYVFEFCALMLAWEARDLGPSMNILELMDEAFPDSWRPRYLMGINAMYFAQDNQTARDHFIAASKKPNAPVFLARLAVKKLANLNSPDTAVAFLKSMIAQASDPNQKKAFEEHLNKTLHTIRLKELQDIVDEHKKKDSEFKGPLNNLVESSLLKDPFGGTYYVDKQGQVKSTSNVETTKLFKYRASPMAIKEAGAVQQ